MGDNLLMFILLMIGLLGGVSIKWAIDHVREWLPDWLRGRKKEGDEEEKKVSEPIPEEERDKITAWLLLGVKEGVLESPSMRVLGTNQRALYRWLRGAPFAAVSFRRQISKRERTRLTVWFWGVIVYLITVGIICTWWLHLELDEQVPSLWSIAIVSGILGSSIAAFRSSLDRRSHGFEDQYGNVAPGVDKQERFSDGMVYWFLGRPLLGGAVALIIYFGLNGEIFCAAAKEEILKGNWKFVFYATLVGLFAKSILDILLKAVKEVFHV